MAQDEISIDSCISLKARARAVLGGFESATQHPPHTVNVAQSIVELLRSECEIDRDIRNSLADAIERGFPSGADANSDFTLIVKGPVGKADPMRKAATKREYIDVYRRFEASEASTRQEKIEEACEGSFSAASFDNARKEWNNFEEWYERRKEAYIKKWGLDDALDFAVSEYCENG